MPSFPLPYLSISMIFHNSPLRGINNRPRLLFLTTNFGKPKYHCNQMNGIAINRWRTYKQTYCFMLDNNTFARSSNITIVEYFVHVYRKREQDEIGLYLCLVALSLKKGSDLDSHCQWSRLKNIFLEYPDLATNNIKVMWKCVTVFQASGAFAVKCAL